jgi:hypothetical protein
MDWPAWANRRARPASIVAADYSSSALSSSSALAVGDGESSEPERSTSPPWSCAVANGQPVRREFSQSMSPSGLASAKSPPGTSAQ